PCALVLSVPLAFFSGIGAGSKRGILFKGGISLEAMKNVRAVVMDKTGTITQGNLDRKSTRLNSSHVSISYAVFCSKKKIKSTKNSLMCWMKSARKPSVCLNIRGELDRTEW